MKIKKFVALFFLNLKNFSNSKQSIDFLIFFSPSLTGCVKFRIKFRTKCQIKCLKMNSKMIQGFLSKNKIEQIMNKICLFILFEFKKI